MSMEFWFQQTQKGDDQGKGKHIKNGTQPAGRNDGMSLNASKLSARETDNLSVRKDDKPENQDEDRKREQPEMMTGRFTAVEGVPGVWPQHISSVLHDAASL